MFEAKQKIDPDFALMKFQLAYGFFGKGYWRGEVYFKPLERKINLSISSGRSGISDKQMHFYREIEKNYAEITDQTLEILYGTLHSVMPLYFGEYTREETLGYCELESVYIPDLSTPDGEWSLSYLYLPHNQSYSVYFNGWKPIYGLYDD